MVCHPARRQFSKSSRLAACLLTAGLAPRCCSRPSLSDVVQGVQQQLCGEGALSEPHSLVGLGHHLLRSLTADLPNLLSPRSDLYVALHNQARTVFIMQDL